MSILIKIEAHSVFGKKVDLIGSRIQNLKIPVAILKLAPIKYSLCQFSLKLESSEFWDYIGPNKWYKTYGVPGNNF